MANVGGKLGMKVMTILVGIPIARVSKKMVARTWVAARPEDPPHGLKERDVKWSDAVGYAALAAAGAAATKLVTRKGAETSYRKLTGLEPPPPPPTKAQKKLAKVEKKAQKKAAKESAAQS